MRNKDKTTSNNAKQFTKKKTRFALNKFEEFHDPETSLVTKCKFFEKEHGLNKC